MTFYNRGHLWKQSKQIMRTLEEDEEKWRDFSAHTWKSRGKRKRTEEALTERVMNEQRAGLRVQSNVSRFTVTSISHAHKKRKEKREDCHWSAFRTHCCWSPRTQHNHLCCVVLSLGHEILLECYKNCLKLIGLCFTKKMFSLSMTKSLCCRRVLDSWTLNLLLRKIYHLLCLKWPG